MENKMNNYEEKNGLDVMEGNYAGNETEEALLARTDIDNGAKAVMIAYASNRAQNKGTDYEEELKAVIKRYVDNGMKFI